MVSRLWGVLLGAAVLAAPTVASAQEGDGLDRNAMLIAGTAMEVTGVFGLLVSTPFTVGAATCGDECSANDVPLWPVMVASGALIAGGIPLIVVGLDDDEPPARSGKAASVSLRLGAGGVSVGGRF